MRDPFFASITATLTRSITRHPKALDTLGQAGMREATWNADPSSEHFQRRSQNAPGLRLDHDGSARRTATSACSPATIGLQSMRHSYHQDRECVAKNFENNAISTSADGLGSRPLAPAPLLAPRAGLEPATLRLTAARSTIELPRNGVLNPETHGAEADAQRHCREAKRPLPTRLPRPSGSWPFETEPPGPQRRLQARRAS